MHVMSLLVIRISSTYIANRMHLTVEVWDSRVHFTKTQSMREDKLTEFHSPCTWALLQTIEIVMKMIYLGSFLLNRIPWWLFLKDTLSKITLGEGVRRIKLINR